MFHELWLAGYRSAPLKERVVGSLQRACILHLLRTLRPDALSTSNSPYANMLAAAGFPAQRVPMFGSIPLATPANPNWISEALVSAEVPSAGLGKRWLLTIFASLHPIWPPEPLFTYLQEGGLKQGRSIVVISIGKLGPGEALWNQFAARYHGAISFAKLGERSAAEV